ncbi:MAG: Trm112 family protein [Planctomycetota bacterium]
MSDAPAPSDSPSAEPAIDAELLAILVCPLTRSPLRQEGSELVAEVGGLRYPIRDGIPVLLVHEATLPDTVTSLDDFKQRYAEHIPDAG